MRWAGRRRILSSCLPETILEKDRKLVHRLFSIERESAPVGRDVVQRHPDQLTTKSSLGK
jgi:hypothetical protein